ncbi:hypothetical protein PUR61_06910, partial [Streptomyces sp. BE20]|uniref:hypothetical protein n=1 Tax=Streptomyces sp. BE20 TaxID=3002525 RepID=UPI002E7768B4
GQADTGLVEGGGEVRQEGADGRPARAGRPRAAAGGRLGTKEGGVRFVCFVWCGVGAGGWPGGGGWGRGG